MMLLLDTDTAGGVSCKSKGTFQAHAQESILANSTELVGKYPKLHTQSN